MEKIITILILYYGAYFTILSVASIVGRAVNPRAYGFKIYRSAIISIILAAWTSAIHLALLLT